MKERGPRHTFAENSFGRFVQKHRITMEIAAFDPVRLVTGPPIQETNLFVATLSKGERSYTRNFIFDRMLDVMPQTEDVLEFIANEIAINRYYQMDPARCAKALGYDLKDPQFLGYMENLKQVVSAVRLFLGNEAYEEFIDITEVRGP